MMFVRRIFNTYIYFIVLCCFLLVNTVQAEEEQTEFECLVEAIYFEARNQTFISQLAVANVIMERVRLEWFPSTVCGVVHEGRKWKGAMVRHACEFSYYCDGKNESMKEPEAIVRAMEVAELAMSGGLVEDTLGATHYHATYVNPYWTDSMEYLGQIGQHKFYVE